MREFADKLRDKNLTVGEALEIASKDAPKSRIERLNTFRNNLKKIDIVADTPFEEIGKAENLKLISEFKGDPFARLTTIQNRINGVAASLDIQLRFQIILKKLKLKS